MTYVNQKASFEAYEKIKRGILDLRYRPGEKLSETRLADDLNLGRSPIRTALARLGGEGWIKVLPQSGTFVRDLTPQEVADIADLRLLLEAHAAQRAAERIVESDLAMLRNEFEALKAKGVDGHFDEFLKLDDRFHTTLHRVSGNQRIAEILQNLRDQIHWIRVVNAIVPGRVAESLKEMDHVLVALERRDGEGAARAMRQHIGNIANSFAALAVDEAPHDTEEEPGRD
jgi:DNA-binding GntR family transcriptional regulator